MSSIYIERRIKFSQWSHSQSVKDQISACLGRNISQEAHTLYVVPGSLEWFDVSQALIGLLVKKPNPDSVIVLETMLASNLKGLQRKGFNVNRILRKKQKEQEEADALAEAEREKLKTETQERIRQQKETLPNPEEKSKELVSSNTNKTPNETPRMAPPARPHNPNATRGIPPPLPVANQRGFFSRMFKTPTAPQPQNPAITSGPSSGLGKAPGRPGQEGDGSKLLEQGIKGSRAFTSDSLGAPPSAPTPAPDAINTEKECNSGEATNIKLATRLQGGPPIYLSQGMPALTNEWMIEAVRFKSILFIISQNIFQIPWDAIHMHVNTNSAVIAFNYGGSLFFNLAYFVANALTPARRPGEGNWRPIVQLDYWFTVFAHELAHNLCQPHGATHSYYT